MPAMSVPLCQVLIELGTQADLHMFAIVMGVSEYRVAGLEGAGSQRTSDSL